LPRTAEGTSLRNDRRKTAERGWLVVEWATPDYRIRWQSLISAWRNPTQHTFLPVHNI
jgi:hypothetical protein